MAPNKLHNKASQTGQKSVVTFLANGAIKAPSIFCRCWRRYMPMRNIITLLTIFSLCSSLSVVAGSWYEVAGSQRLKFHKPTFEDKLWDYVIKSADTEFEDRNKYSYKYQVNGSIILIHAYCDITESDIKSEQMFLPLDGGSCYFEVQYDYKLKKFLLVAVNGEA